ncbi:MAG: DUF6463 family protein [Chloroflexia bacterium]
MRRPTRYIGETMIGLGATHIAGIALFHRQFRAMAREGLVGTVEGRPDRELAFWFTIFGPVLIAHGQFARWSLRRTGALPEGWAWNLPRHVHCGRRARCPDRASGSGYRCTYYQSPLLALRTRKEADADV